MRQLACLRICIKGSVYVYKLIEEEQCLKTFCYQHPILAAVNLLSEYMKPQGAEGAGKGTTSTCGMGTWQCRTVPKMIRRGEKGMEPKVDIPVRKFETALVFKGTEQAKTAWCFSFSVRML